jgi:hypothetical protein
MKKKFIYIHIRLFTFNTFTYYFITCLFITSYYDQQNAKIQFEFYFPLKTNSFGSVVGSGTVLKPEDRGFESRRGGFFRFT